MRPAKLLKIAENIFLIISYYILLLILTGDLIITELSSFEIFEIMKFFLKFEQFLMTSLPVKMTSTGFDFLRHNSSWVELPYQKKLMPYDSSCRRDIFPKSPYFSIFNIGKIVEKRIFSNIQLWTPTKSIPQNLMVRSDF